MSSQAEHVNLLRSACVVMPVRNEAANISAAIQSVLSQDFDGPLGLIVVDGGSTDGTRDIVTDFVRSDRRVTMVDNPPGTAAAGMNIGIAGCTSDVVVRCDGHAVLPQNYVSTAMAILNDTGADNVGGGQRGVGTTATERSIAAAMAHPFGVGNAHFRTRTEPGPVDTVYLGNYRRATLVELGGFDETMIRNQDYELNHRIIESGGVVYFDPRLTVDYSPRPTLGTLWRQYFDYGRGKRAMLRDHPTSLKARQLAPVMLVLGLIGSVLLLPSPLRWMSLVVPVSYIVAVLATSVTTSASRGDWGLMRLCAVFPVMHIAWGCGFLFGRRLTK